MIDKLDVLASSRHDQISDQFLSALADRRTFTGRSSIRPFAERRDFGRLGLPFVVHNSMVPTLQSPGFLRNFRIELSGEGRENLLNTLQQLSLLLGTDVLDARVMRVDLAVDVPDMSLSWLREHVWIAYKRSSKAFALQPVKKSVDTIEGLTFGRRPNLIRIYDKVRQLSLIKGNTPSGVLTRFERQYGGRGLPVNFRYVGRLIESVSDAKPFASVRFLDRDSEPDISTLDGLSGKKLLTSAGYIYLSSHLGAAELRRRLGPNRTRILGTMPTLKNRSHQDIDLDRLFQASVSSQLLSISMLELSA
jgi:hypothetical protein